MNPWKKRTNLAMCILGSAGGRTFECALSCFICLPIVGWPWSRSSTSPRAPYIPSTTFCFFKALWQQRHPELGRTRWNDPGRTLRTAFTNPNLNRTGR
eukprot:s599_g6.t2